MNYDISNLTIVLKILQNYYEIRKIILKTKRIIVIKIKNKLHKYYIYKATLIT